jgi:hypothetical protein
MLLLCDIFLLLLRFQDVNNFKKAKMKKVYVFVLILTGVIGLAMSTFTKRGEFGFYHKTKLYPDGVGIAGNTGAPGESTCASCHGASLKIGGAESTLTFKDSVNSSISSYKPNHTYNLTFALSLLNNKGFQVVALDANNKQAGTLSAGSSTLITTQAGKQYLNHSDNFNSSWSFKWKAPNSDIGEITFYVAAGNKRTIYKSSYKLAAFVESKTNGIKINENNFEFTAFYVAASQNLYLKYDANLKGDGFVNVLDMNGRSVAYKKLGPVNGTSTKEIELPLAVQPGTYVINMFVNNYMSNKKIVVF